MDASPFLFVLHGLFCFRPLWMPWLTPHSLHRVLFKCGLALPRSADSRAGQWLLLVATGYYRLLTAACFLSLFLSSDHST